MRYTLKKLTFTFLFLLAMIAFFSCSNPVTTDDGVTGVSIEIPESRNIILPGTLQLTANVTPADATDASVVWSSSNAAVATVSDSGLVTGVADGMATITVTTTDGGYTDTIDVTVALTTVSEAKPEDDNKVTGVYKGVLADDDSSGTFKIEIENNSPNPTSSINRAAGDVYAATLYLEINGTLVTTAGTATELADGSYDVGFNLSVLSLNFEFDLNVTATGDVNECIVKKDNEIIMSTTVKETSDTVVQAWEGTYSGTIDGTWENTVDMDDDGTPETTISGPWTSTVSGTWNFILVDSVMEGGVFAGKETWHAYYNGQVVDEQIDDSADGTYEGTITNGTVSVFNFKDADYNSANQTMFYTTAPDRTGTGTVSGNTGSGTWTEPQDTNNDGNNDGSTAGTWEGIRTR